MRDIDRAIDAHRAREDEEEKEDIWGPDVDDHNGGMRTMRRGSFN